MPGNISWSGYSFSSLYSRSCLQNMLIYCNPRKHPGTDLPERCCPPRFLWLLMLPLCKSHTTWLPQGTLYLFEGKNTQLLAAVILDLKKLAFLFSEVFTCKNFSHYSFSTNSRWIMDWNFSFYDSLIFSFNFFSVFCVHSSCCDSLSASHRKAQHRVHWQWL